MKKIAAALLITLIITLSTVCVCYAGDVPEGLLYTDGAQLYFGKVMESSESCLTVLPLKKVMGDVEINTAITYTKGFHGSLPRVGKTYLFGYVDENNVYFWVTDSMDPKTLKVKDQNGMNKRLQDYLNNGDYEKAEEARLKKATAATNSTPTIAPTIIPTPAPASTPSFAFTSTPVSSARIPATTSPQATEMAVAAAAESSNRSAVTPLEPSLMLLVGAIIVAGVVSLMVILRKAQRR